MKNGWIKCDGSRVASHDDNTLLNVVYEDDIEVRCVMAKSVKWREAKYYQPHVSDRTYPHDPIANGPYPPAEASGHYVGYRINNGEIGKSSYDDLNWGISLPHEYQICEWWIVGNVEHKQPPPLALPRDRDSEHIKLLDLLVEAFGDLGAVPMLPNSTKKLIADGDTIDRLLAIVNSYDAEIVQTMMDGTQITRKDWREFLAWKASKNNG